ncbi:SDR family NAD(P)-dependent oxidoreductase [Mycobacteroides salmoniphilum]|uniref:SDR family NAD(P)-dependent oxidoreductase n=1 Tax=Mycobacteroides salmoniphilum TaxID=404941 RepID=UPI000992F7D2|nr:SDR family NAD(P)-dependent oxidoreductase [Mycobacteroides salmoniphilum]
MSTQTVVIVGAGPGVGYETARRFVSAGYAVGLIRRDARALDSFAAALKVTGARVATTTADADQPDTIASAVSRLGRELGGIDVLLYNVPDPLRDAYGPATGIAPSALQAFLTVRVVSALAALQAALPFLEISQGAAFFTSGQSDRHAYANTGLIGTPQAALRMLTQHLHTELASSGVFVGYLPLDNPPMYSDPDQEKRRTDIPDGFAIPERVTASDVADKIFALNRTRDVFERPVRPSVRAAP